VVATAADAGYEIPLAAMLKSVLSGLRDGSALSVHVVGMDISKAARERLSKICAVRGAGLAWHDRSSRALDRLPVTSRMTMATYGRLELSRLLPAGVSKVLWLDSDVLVTTDLERLWTADLAGRHLLAVRDPCVPLVSSRYGIRSWRELGLPERAKYFNAGVMLIDLDRWRRDEIGERATEYLRERSADVMFWDQEGLNAVLCGRWGELDVRWNYCSGLTPREQPEAARVEPWIIHFAGTLKPWQLPVPESGPRELFYRLLEETPWAGWRPRRTPSSVARGWYESSRLRDVLYPAEHWWMLHVRRRLPQIAMRVIGRGHV
jgi:lipopolysaccharide biosynthesis glycosyltransferase